MGWPVMALTHKGFHPVSCHFSSPSGIAEPRGSGGRGGDRQDLTTEENGIPLTSRSSLRNVFPTLMSSERSALNFPLVVKRCEAASEGQGRVRVKTHCRVPNLSDVLCYLGSRGQDVELFLTGK